MASGWHLERYEKAAAAASWTGDFSDFAQALEFAMAVFGSGKEESIRFTAPDGANEAQVKQLIALGAWEIARLGYGRSGSLVKGAEMIYAGNDLRI